MIMKFLRENIYAASLITVLRLYIGWQWLTAGWGKVTEGFSAEGYLLGVVGNEAVLEQYPRYHTFIENVALPHADTFSFMVAWGELLVGLGLLLGVMTTAAAFFGLMMNFSFLFAGTISSNPWMILLTIFIIVAGANAGRFGGDRYLLPFIREKLQKNKLKQKSTITSSDKLAS